MRLCIEIGGWDLLALPEGRVLGLEVGGSRLGERMVRRILSMLLGCGFVVECCGEYVGLFRDMLFSQSNFVEEREKNRRLR